MTKAGAPILYVSHEQDPEEVIIWQFHSGDGDYRAGVLQLVRLDEILALDPELRELADLPLGHCARRDHATAAWAVSILD